MAAPILQNQNPPAGTDDYNDLAPLEFEIVDADSDLVAASVVIKIGGRYAWFDDAEKGGFKVTKSAVTNGFKYSIDQSALAERLPPGSTLIEVYAEDALSAVLDTSYSLIFWRGEYYDDHEDGSLSSQINILSGNGYVSESGGALRVGSAGGVNLDWYTFGRNGKLPQVAINANTAIHRRTIIETVEESYTGSGNEHEMWGAWLDDQNHYWLYSEDGSPGTLSSYRVENNSWTYLAGHGTPAYPRRKRLILDWENDQVIYELWSGSAWTQLNTETLNGRVPTHMFWYHKDWQNGVVESAYSESQIKHEFYGSDEVKIGEDEGNTRDLRAQNYEDFSFAPMRGPVDHLTGFTGAMRAPGPKDAQVDRDHQVGPWPTGTMQDEYEVAVDSNAFLNYEQVIPTGMPQDAFDHLLSVDAQFSPHVPTLDPNANQHLITDTVIAAFYYDRTGEIWSNPTTPGFNGFAADGTKYTNGVQDAGPVFAPWSTEPLGVDRGTRDDWPVKSLIVLSELELTVFDLDLFDSGGLLSVFWRTRIGNSGSATFSLFGRVANSLRGVAMQDGVLVVCSKHNGTENGGLFFVDFKRDGLDQDWAQLIRSDGHWKVGAGVDSTDRNTGVYQVSGVSSLRLRSEHLYSIAIHTDPNDWKKKWVALGGEDSFEVIEIGDEDNVPTADYHPTPDDGPTALGFIRSVDFDQNGLLWLSEERHVWCARLDYQRGALGKPKSADSNAAIRQLYPLCKVPTAGYLGPMRAGTRYVYAIGPEGVWQIEKNQHPRKMRATLAYTREGGNGGGRLDNPPDGELLPGESVADQSPDPNWAQDFQRNGLWILRGSKTDFIFLWDYRQGTGNGVRVIRTHDGEIMIEKFPPDLQGTRPLMLVGYPV